MRAQPNSRRITRLTNRASTISTKSLPTPAPLRPGRKRPSAYSGMSDRRGVSTQLQSSAGTRVFAVTNVLTNHLPHGDGLIAWQHLNRLVRRGIEGDVLGERVSVVG